MDINLSSQILIGNFRFTIEELLLTIGLVIIFFVVLKIILNLIKNFLKTLKHDKKKVFLIKLPKEKPNEQENEERADQIKEEISKGETIFSSIGGLRAQRGIKTNLLGREDIFGFEVVAHNNKIAFYVATPENNARYLEQQIHAHYPEASIEEVPDYNAFNPQNEIIAGYLKTTKEFIFSLKTYQEMEVDPMNSIINILSKLEKDESMAIQYLVRSAKNSWHRRIKKAVEKIYKTQSVKNGIKKPGFFSVLGEMWEAAAPSKKDDQMNTNQKTLTPAEEEMIKKMEEKNSKAGLDVNIRIIISAKNKGKAQNYLHNLSNAFSEYNNYEYGNKFGKIKQKNQDKIIKDFIYRRFEEKINFILNTTELTSLFHFPLKHTETPNIIWLTARTAPAPADVPQEGLLLGKNSYRGVEKDIYIKQQDRRRHTYVIGKSGVGKSVLLTNMAIQDIENGEGVCVLDPHGDLIDDILNRVPPERAEDVIVFSPGDLERPMALNLLEYDPKFPEQKSFVINEVIGIFDKLYDLKSTGGPMFEQYMRNALLLIMEDPDSGSTLMEVPKVLADEKFRKMKLERCQNKTVVDFWKKEAEKAGGDAALANIVPYITSKLTSFISNDMMRPIIGQQNSSFNLREIMDKQKILLIDLPKGVVGEMNAYLLGMILVGKILMAALSRANASQENRKDFYLYIDEFQNFTTNSICQILSEARKYALNLTVAHQYIGQLNKGQDTEIKDAVFGNVGTMISFKVGSDDAEYLVKDFSPVFNEYDLINVGKGATCTKLLVDNTATRPFSMNTIFPLMGQERKGMADKIRSLSRIKYGKDKRIIESEIEKRVGNF